MVYADAALYERLKEIAAQEGRTVVAILRRLVGVAEIVEDVDEIGPTDPIKRWVWVKQKLGVKCGCLFDDEMMVHSVADWGLFRTINNGKLMELYLSTHPEERDKYSGVTAQATGTG